MQHATVSQDEWIEARKELLRKEKELTRLRDRVSAERRALPWVKVEKPYVFEGPNGRETLADLFEGRSQLIVKHFMFGPGWKEGCVGCSFLSDHLDGFPLAHLAQRDVAYVAVSRAPLPELEAFKRRMGWHFKWVSSFGSDFNYDFQASASPQDIVSGQVYYNYRPQPLHGEEMTGMSVFYKDAAGGVFHTYSCYARAGEATLAIYTLLDLTPKGREETINGNLTDWVRHHDRYAAGGFVDPTGRYVATEEEACCATPAEPR